MRQFDYTTVPAELEATPITNLLLSIREHKGRQLVLSQVKPELLSSLMEEAKIQSTQSSNGLEGIVTTQKRLKAIMAYSAKPSSRAEEEIAGYRDVLSLIHEQHDSIPVTPSVILQLHRDLMAHTAISYGGHWKDSDNEIVSIDDQGNRFVRFRPPSALATPGLIKEACQSLNDALSRQVCDPLLISLRFIFDFVSIHPFNDGNGRMSRLLTTLLLYRSGFYVGKYISLEAKVAKNKDLYYDALRQSQTGWHDGKEDAIPFIKYLLGVILSAYRDFEERFSLVEKKQSAFEMVNQATLHKIGRFTKQDIRELCPSLSISSVEGALRKLVASGELVREGSGKSTRYYRIN